MRKSDQKVKLRIIALAAPINYANLNDVSAKCREKNAVNLHVQHMSTTQTLKSSERSII